MGIARAQMFPVSMWILGTMTWLYPASESSKYELVESFLRTDSYIVKCCSRIKWLEQKIRALDPSFDLTKGPQIDADLFEGSSLPWPPHQSPSSAVSDTPPRAASSTEMASAVEGPATGKRSHASMEESEIERPPSVEARTVAMDLGMLSLQSDSRQKHYLGSSSGLLFMKLIGAGADVQTSGPAPSPATRRLRRMSSPHRPSGVYQSLYAGLERELPSPEDADRLLAVYFQYIHIDHPFLHPTSLINAYNALHACGQRGYDPARLDQNGWLHDIKRFPYNGKMDVVNGRAFTPISISFAVFHVFMVFSLAATVLTRKKNFDHPPIRFYRMAMLAASECFSNISVPALQGVLLLAIQGMTEPAGLNIWTLVHIAMSHCVDLGLHREPNDPSDLPPVALAVRRLIFYTVYSLDRYLCPMNSVEQCGKADIVQVRFNNSRSSAGNSRRDV